MTAAWRQRSGCVPAAGYSARTMAHAFFTGKREQFFRPLTHGDRECCAAVLRSLYDRIHGPNADYSEALTRELVVGMVFQALAEPVGARVRVERLYGVASLDGFGAFEEAEVSALGLIAAYLETTQAGRLPALTAPRRAGEADIMAIDPATRTSLEIERSRLCRLILGDGYGVAGI